MKQHWNIASKKDINPFEDVKWVRVIQANATGARKLDLFLQKKANNSDVKLEKVNDAFSIYFDIKLLDFITLVSWFSPDRGKFYFEGDSVHFSIDGEFIICW